MVWVIIVATSMRAIWVYSSVSIDSPTPVLMNSIVSEVVFVANGG
jgi:hypothetical protein